MGKLVDGLLAYLGRTSEEQLVKDWDNINDVAKASSSLTIEEYREYTLEFTRVKDQPKDMTKDEKIAYILNKADDEFAFELEQILEPKKDESNTDEMFYKNYH